MTRYGQLPTLGKETLLEERHQTVRIGERDGSFCTISHQRADHGNGKEVTVFGLNDFYIADPSGNGQSVKSNVVGELCQQKKHLHGCFEKNNDKQSRR